MSGRLVAFGFSSGTIEKYSAAITSGSTSKCGKIWPLIFSASAFKSAVVYESGTSRCLESDRR